MAKCYPPSGSGRVRLAKCYPPLRSGQVRLAKWLCCSCSNIVFTMVLPLASFAEVGFVCGKCQKWLRNRNSTGGSRRGGKPLSVGRVKRDRLRHVPAFACKYNRWKSESALPCKQQEIYREIFSRKLNRQNLARTRASRPGFHLAAKAPGGGPPHDIPSSQRAKTNARRGNPHRDSNTII